MAFKNGFTHGRSTDRVAGFFRGGMARWSFVFGTLVAVYLVPATSMTFSAWCAEIAVRVQGSTTFQADIWQHYQSEIERRSGQTFDIVANKSSWGLLALLDGRADLAMISAPLAAEIIAAQKLKPELDFGALQEFRVAQTRVAFALHPDNPVTTLSFDTIARILNGELTNWQDVDGPDLPIVLVAIKEGGGTMAAVRAQMLGEAPLAPGAIRLESAKHVAKVVSQERGAIGVMQLGLLKQAGLKEAVMERALGQPLSFVTLGPPTDAMQRVIAAARSVTAGRQ